MDNHPIPQDVTNFQFRLIGDMTLKQFGYVVGGVVLAWIMLASPLFFLLKFLLAGMCVLGAVILAFVPIEGRPSDIMVMHFLKALFSPTQFLYQKSSFSIPTAPQKNITEQKIKTQPAVQVTPFSPTASAAVKISETIKQAPTQAVLPKEKIQQETVLQQEAQQLSQELEKARSQEAHVQNGAPASNVAHEKVLDLEKELQEVQKQKQDLEQQLIMLQKTLTEKKQQVFTPSTATIPQETQHVKKIPKQMGTGVGTPFASDVPNLITGIIKDARGNVQGNILIEVKDKEGNPVRAFKTNQLGQFASATPLLNGTYTISFEDPTGKQTFDSVEMVADGNILLPLEITSVDAREKLRQELFGATSSV